MPAKLHRCVQHVREQGHDEASAWAICQAALEGKTCPDGVTADLWQAAVRLARADGGNTFKAVTSTPEELRIANYIVLFGSPDGPSLTAPGRDLEGLGSPRLNPDGSRGDYFTPETLLDSTYTATGALHIDWEHGRDPEGKGLDRDTVLGIVDWKTAQPDERGVWVQRVLSRRNQYVQWLEALIEAGLVGNSTEPVQQEVKRADDGRILNWPLYRDTLTVTPMDPRMLAGNTLAALKALNLFEAKAIQPAPQPTGGSMNLIEKIKQLVPGLADEQYNQLAAVIELAMADPAQVFGKQEVPEEMAVELDQAQTGADLEGKTLKRMVVLAGQKLNIKQPWAVKPAEARPEAKAAARPPYAFKPAEAKPEAKPEEVEELAAKSVVNLRLGDEDAKSAAIMRGVIGSEYRQRIYDQNVAFAKYLRHGERGIDAQEYKALKSLYLPEADVLQMARDGMTVSEMKTVMVQAQGTLGGFAVPPNVQQDIVTRLPGLTAVRGGGARVIDLINSDTIEAPTYTGGDSRYRGNLRGTWAAETATPGAQNATLGLTAISANVYTYKVGMSQSLVENAQNLVSLVQSDIADTLAIDEDEAFLIGDGVGKPLGILPGSDNALSLTEVKSANASTLTAAGIKALKRGVASQYRARGVWVGNSDTYGAIEVLTVATASSTYAFPDLSEESILLGRKVFESEAMPDVGAGKYPLLFLDMSAYWIVQRAGLTIARFQDSNTGINKVEFHVRRLIGGRLVETYKAAVQVVSA